MILKIWCWGSNNARTFGDAEYLYIAITLRSTLTQSDTAESAGAVEYTDYISVEG